jgi:hypothetical protein
MAERVTRANLEGWPKGKPAERKPEDMWVGERQLIELFVGPSSGGRGGQADRAPNGPS